MPVIKTLRNQLEQVSALKVITGAFSELSALKINDIRETFEKNSLYFEEVSQVYHLVKRVAEAQKINLANKDSSAKYSRRSLHIGITSNHGFYGALNNETIDEMRKHSMETAADRIVIGKVGTSYARSIQVLSPFNAVVFKKDDPDDQEVQSLLESTKQYKTIYVYYPKFVSVFKQQVDRVDITHSPTPVTNTQHDIKYIFEPEIEKILAFFEVQVRYILFVRVLLETSLSRTATRLITMDSAERKATNVIDTLRADMNRIRQSEINEQLIASAGQLRKWRIK